MKNGVSSSCFRRLFPAFSRGLQEWRINRESPRNLPVSRGQRYDPLLHVTELMLPPLSARLGPLSSGLAAIFLSLLAMQTPASRAGEFPITGALAGDQDFPAASISADGGYLVWEDNRIDGGKGGTGIAAAGLNSSLASTGGVFRVNQQTAGSQKQPQILRLRNGGTLI